MPRILLIGYDPDTVDFSDPALPPGTNADKIRAGIAEAMKRIRDHGWQGDGCMIRPDGTALGDVERALSATEYDCIVIGGGVRMPAKSLPLLEAIIDVVRREAPATPIAFNAGPEETLEAARRWVKEA